MKGYSYFNDSNSTIVHKNLQYYYVHYFLRAFLQENGSEEYNLQCNTEKDKTKLHYRSAGTLSKTCYYNIPGSEHIIFTAGILAGIWPCGVITIVHELFRSEGKAQVYGSLHTFFYENPSTTNRVGRTLFSLCKTLFNS